jgi:hypothetical protein
MIVTAAGDRSPGKDITGGVSREAAGSLPMTERAGVHGIP